MSVNLGTVKQQALSHMAVGIQNVRTPLKVTLNLVNFLRHLFTFDSRVLLLRIYFKDK